MGMLDENLGNIPEMPDPTLLFDLKGKRVYVAGHRGMVGSAIARRLSRKAAKSSPRIENLST